MAYYIKIAVTDAYYGRYTVSEIEAYLGLTKVPLTCIYVTTESSSHLHANITDGILYTTYWVDGTADGSPNDIIVKANSPFDNIKVYSGANYDETNGSLKTVKVYDMQSVSDPSYTNVNWVLQDTRTYPMGPTVQSHTVVFPISFTQRPQAIGSF